MFETKSSVLKTPLYTPIALALVALAIYSPLIGWGVPTATSGDRTKTFAIDEILPLEALAEMHNTFVVSKPDRNYGYPWFHYFVVAAAQTPYVAYLKLSGGMSKSSPEYPFGLRDPVGALRTLTLIGRAVSVLMAVGIVLVAYFFSSTLWDHKTGVAAALLTMVNYLMVYYGRLGNLDVPMFFWSSLGMVVYARILTQGFTVRRAVLLGVFVGLAGATKDQAAVLFLPLGLSLLFPGFAGTNGRVRTFRPQWIAAAACLVAYVAGTGMLVDPQRHFTHVYRVLLEPERLSSASFYLPLYPRTWSGVMGMLGDYGQALGEMMSWPVLLLSVAGMIQVRKTSPRLLIFWLCVVLHFFVLVLPVGWIVRRYLLPYSLFVDAFAAHFLMGLEGRMPRLVPRLLLAALVGWRLLPGIDLSYAQVKETRYAAAAWLESHTKPGDRIEFFGMPQKLPAFPAGVDVRRIEGRTKWKRESLQGSRALQYLEGEGPDYILVIPDASSSPGLERSGDCPPEVYEALNSGATRYRLAVYFPPPALLPKPLSRPRLDNPSVSPPVRIFARQVAAEGQGGP